jgi:hypothetical protein
VSDPDFEIGMVLRARELVAHVPPDTETEAENVTLTRRQTSGGLPGRLEPGKRYEDVLVEQRLVGEQRPSGAHGDEQASAEPPEA